MKKSPGGPPKLFFSYRCSSLYLLEHLFWSESLEICARRARFGRAGDGEESIVIGPRRVSGTSDEGREMGLDGVGYLLEILEETEEWVLGHRHLEQRKESE